jgi:hypothetical protein
MKKTIQCFIALVALLFLSVGAYAQVTTSSLGGKITDEKGAAAVGVTVLATHVPSGTVYTAVTNNDGRYTIQGMRIGGPYKVEVSYIGYQTMSFTDITLQLGDLYNLSAKLQEETVQLEDIVIGCFCIFCICRRKIRLVYQYFQQEHPEPAYYQQEYY